MGRLPRGPAAGRLEEEDEASDASGEESGDVRPGLLAAFMIAPEDPVINRNHHFCLKQICYFSFGPGGGSAGARADSPRLASSSETP